MSTVYQKGYVRLMIKPPELKVGTAIDIVFESEINKSNAHFMKAVVYDFRNNDIIISQTSPALNRSFLNRRIMVTFLARTEKRVLRFGLPARLGELLTDYQIASAKGVEALVLKKNGGIEPVDFRMHYRVKLPSQSGISLFLKEDKVNLMDISIGGAKFSYPAKFDNFRFGDKLDCKLIIGATTFNIEARVRNISRPQDPAMNKILQYISVEFGHSNRQLETVLGRAIMDIERQLLSEGKIA